MIEVFIYIILFLLCTHLIFFVLIKNRYNNYKVGDRILISDTRTYDIIKHIENGVIYTGLGRIYTFQDYLKNKFN